MNLDQGRPGDPSGDGPHLLHLTAPRHVCLLISGRPEPCRADGTQTCVHQSGDTNWCFTAPDVAAYASADIDLPVLDRIALVDELAALRERNDALVCKIQQAIAAAGRGGDPLPFLRAAVDPAVLYETAHDTTQDTDLVLIPGGGGGAP